MSEQKKVVETTGVEERAPQPVVAGIDPAELVKLVAATVGEVLKPILSQIQAGQGYSQEQIFATVGKAVASGIADTQRRAISFGEYIAKPHSPNRQDMSLKLTRPTFQNGFFLNDSLLTDDEIVLCNAITHSGRYCDRFVEVAVAINGPDTELYINFPNATADQRFALREHVNYSPRRHKTVFQAMLEEILEAQKEERAEKEVEDAMRQEVRALAKERLARPGQGHVGGSKAFREAQEKAAAKEAAGA